MPKVLNKYKDSIGPGDVYIGRGSKWGNPYVIGEDGNRAQVIEKYSRYLDQHPELIQAAKTELKGKNLVCFCKPQACHGDILMEIVNE
jgi:GH15 family glucan-1,4-alpha-glucosidase